MSFKVADGYVEVHARHDRASTRRNAQEAVDIADEEGRKREGSLLRWLFKSNPELHKMLEAPIGAIFSSPIIFAAAATMALGVAGFLATAITTALLTGIAVGFVGIAAFVHREALKGPWKKMTEDIKGVFQRASMPIVQPLINAINMISPAFKRMEPAFTRIYEALAPLIEPFTGGLLGFLEAMLPGIERAMPGIQTVVLALADNLPGLGTAMGDFFATIADNGPLLKDVVGLMITWLENFFKVAGPVLVFFMYAFVGMAMEWKMLMDALKAGWKWVDETWHAIPGWWNETWGAVKGWFKELWNDITGFFSDTGDKISGWWDEQISQIAGWWDQTWGSVTRWFEELPGKIGSFLSSLPEMLYGIFLRAFDMVFYLIGTFIGNAIAGFLGFITGLGTLLQEGWNTITTAVSAAWTAVFVYITTRIAEIVTVARELPGKIHQFFLEMGTRIVATIVRTFHDLMSWWDQLPGRLGRAAQDAWDRVVAVFNWAVTVLPAQAISLVNRLINKVGELGPKFWSIGVDAIKGLVNGIQDYLGWAVDMCWRAANKIKEGFLDALNIGSPSKVMRDEVGKWIPKGIAVGIEDNMGDLDKAAGLLPDMFTGASPAIGGGSQTNDNSTSYGSITVEVHVDNLQELADIQAFLDGNLRNSTKARNWSGNLYEAQGEYTRSYS